MDKESAQGQADRNRERPAKNRVTGLYPPSGFMEKARPLIERAPAEKYCMVAVDIRHFRLFNKFHGRPSAISFCATLRTVWRQGPSNTAAWRAISKATTSVSSCPGVWNWWGSFGRISGRA